MEHRHARLALCTLLELLGRDASAEELAAVTATARAAKASEAELAEIESAVEAALRISHTMAEQRRREARLSALFDTASDLAGLRDTDAVLRSIVHRARMLLGSDVAYLSLNDTEAPQTYMRVTDGSVSALFQQVTLGMGEGLGGLVAQTSRPYATADYAADSRFNHTETIDAAVRDEGLVAILGVPLALGSTVVGVLYAADRSSREFSFDEVALLSSLAAHAAIALDTARLLEETQLAMTELASANDTIRAHNEATNRAQDVHDRLSDLVVRGGDLPEVAAALAAVLDGGIIVHDAHGTELARIDTDPLPPPVDAVRASRATGKAVGSEGTWVCAVLAGPEMLGSVALTGRAELPDADRRLFERASVVTAVLLLLRRSVAQTEDRIRGELLSDLLSAPDRDPAGLCARGLRLGVHLGDPHVVVVAHAELHARRVASSAARLVPARALVGVHAEQAVLIMAEEHPGALADQLARALTEDLGCPVTVGAAGPAEGPGELAMAHAEAQQCLRALLALDRRGCGAALRDLGFLGVLLGDRTNLCGYLRDQLGAVLDYDKHRGTQLIRTLGAYFACGGNLTRTKDELHVHVNTVVQRLERISALLGDDWQASDRALEIQLALRLLLVTG